MLAGLCPTAKLPPHQGESWGGGHDTALRSIRGGNGRLTPVPAIGWLRQ